ncbi:MAG TPA: adenylate/guanylate cyclase domain-containing protein [Myxococcota bacterium]|nr:adenylate/guanylate cyclase domain-containing protein [Myxococcota bacterium]
MRWLRTADLLLLVALTGLWSVCFVLHLGQVVTGRLAWIPVYVAPAQDGAALPTVRALWPGRSADALAPGDAIARVGPDSLAGGTPLDFVRAAYAHAEDARVAVTRVRGGETREVELELVPIAHAWRKSLVAAAFAGLAALAFWRTRGSRAARALYLAMTAYAFHWTDFFGGAPEVTTAALASFGVATSLFMPLALRVATLFPEEVAPPSGREPRWPWLFAANGPVVSAWAFGVPRWFPGASELAFLIQCAFIASLVALLTRSYRRSGATGRRQLRWVVLGFWVGLVPALLASAVALVVPALWWLYEISLLFTLAIPLCLFIALARYNLLDVDRLLTSAAISPLLGIGLITFGFLAVPPTAAAAQSWVSPTVSQPALSLLLAAFAFLLLRRIDRELQDWVYPERAKLTVEAHKLYAELSACEKPADVLTLLGQRLGALLQLQTAAVYARGADAFSPVFAHGPAVSRGFALDGPLPRALAARAAPLEPFASWRDEDPAERRALAEMGVEVALPVLVHGDVAAFACLGGKRSGDVFTATDRALLQGLADRAAIELQRFDHEDVVRETRQQMERLRAYVPGAVARELVAGGQLEPGEREISVLFVDIRGYTSFAEGHSPEAIFDAVNAYTGVVSQIVSDCGGAVVEFNGDGLMTVFGAPRALADKERAAVRAARAIAERVPQLPVRDSGGQPTRLHVGVGVATGPGYVGNVRAADRAIWVALGNTTNLAARLERMTRDLGAAVVVDVETHKAAGDAAADFAPRPAQSVRGRSELLDVFTWSPAESPASQRLQEEVT